MKAIIKCKIDAVGNDQGSNDDKITRLEISTVSGNTFELGGKTLPCSFRGVLLLKPIVASRLKIGSVINIDINVDE